MAFKLYSLYYILFYARELWAPYASDKMLDQLEQAHKQFLRGLVGLPKSTSLQMVCAEFSRLPL